MTRINKNTRRAERLLETASRFEGTNLWDVYGTFSKAKANAYDHYRRMCFEMGGHGFHICSHNSHFFSLSWETETDVYLTTAYNEYVIAK